MQCAIFTTIYPSKIDSLRQNLRQHRKSTALSMLFCSTAKVRIPYGVPKAAAFIIDEGCCFFFIFELFALTMSVIRFKIF
jgi:hypothetical protein